MSSLPGGLHSTVADLYTGGDYEKAKRVIALVRAYDAEIGTGPVPPDFVFASRIEADTPQGDSPRSMSAEPDGAALSAGTPKPTGEKEPVKTLEGMVAAGNMMAAEMRREAINMARTREGRAYFKGLADDWDAAKSRARAPEGRVDDERLGDK